MYPDAPICLSLVNVLQGLLQLRIYEELKKNYFSFPTLSEAQVESLPGPS